MKTRLSKIRKETYFTKSFLYFFLIVQVALEDLSHVILLNRTIFVSELITHVLQLKPQMAAIVGHLLDLSRKEQILNIDHIADGYVVRLICFIL